MSSHPSELPKSSATTTKQNSKRRILIIALYCLAWVLATYLFYRRFPNNFHQPNFFGEEGYVWSNNVIHKGLLRSFGTTFNGYYIWGLYILEGIGFAINKVFFAGEFANLPRSFSIVSYSFLGFMVILPAILFRKSIRLPALVMIGLLIIFVPLRGWDYGVIGALGNMKFVFVYIAFLLLVYRHQLPEGSRKVYLIDILLLICAYTNVTVYALIPFAALRYLPKLKHPSITKIKTLLLQDRSLQSLIVLCVALLPQIYVIKHYGIPPMPGYLDGKYNFSSTIEIFTTRSYFYGLIFPLYKYFTDLISIVIFIVVSLFGLRYAGKYRSQFVFGMIAISLTTLLFVLKRPGVSDFFVDYRDSGPDQFFFTQNWIFGFIFTVVVFRLIGKMQRVSYRVAMYTLLFGAFFIFLVPNAGTYGKNNFMEKTIGNIYNVAKDDCSRPGEEFTLIVYPVKNQRYEHITREQLCTPSVLNYQP